MATKKKQPGICKTQKRPTIVLGLFNEVSEDTIRGIMSAAGEYGWDLYDLSFSDTLIPSFIRPHGAIVQFLPGHPNMDQFRSYACKTVRIGRLPHPDDREFPAVMPDYVGAGRMAASHLAERGFIHLGYIGYHNHQMAQLFWEGFDSRAKELGCQSSRLLLSGKNAPSESRYLKHQAEQVEWIQSLPKPTGVFAYSDHMAGQFCTTCISAGISVPEDVAIIGYGNGLRLCEASPVALSSIEPNLEMMGREAARLLQQIMAGEPPTTSATLIPPRAIIQRHSTDVLAVPSPAVAKALRFIWDHFSEPISAIDIARHAAVSRTGLDGLFRRHLGRTVNAEIGRKRLERCAELLRGSDLSVTDIAILTGFRTRTYLHKQFREAYGISPLDYRRQSS